MIINDKEDLETFNYVKDSLTWTKRERIDNFKTLVSCIGYLLCPSKQYIELLKASEVKLCAYDEIDCWVLIQKADPKVKWSDNTMFFAEEGIKKSPQFCFQMILGQFMIQMQKRMLHRSFSAHDKFFFQGKSFEWCEQEINKRLGLTGYKIYGNLSEFLENQIQQAFMVE